MTLSICEESALGLKSAAGPVKDRQSVSPEGEPISRRIEGVVIHRRPLQEDERGELVEIYSPEWGIHSHPLVYAYFFSIRPRQIKGWVLHKLQDDGCSLRVA
jgi:dTDP-4-dehydrorhamnose 3,5-epimerase